VLVTAAAVAAATAYFGWWSVPLVAAIAARVFPHAPVRTAALGGALGWGGLLAWSAWQAPVAPLLHRLGGLLHLPGWGLVALTLIFPTLLAGASARAVRTAPYR
jgi:hypothetical protein